MSATGSAQFDYIRYLEYTQALVRNLTVAAEMTSSSAGYHWTEEENKCEQEPITIRPGSSN